jgi:acyl-CoA synthetase (AMP-forming)/AMP-acid ligase II
MSMQLGPHPRAVAAVAAADGDRVAVVDGGRTLTFGEIDARANGLAARLAEGGVGPGDPVGMMLHNRAEWFIASHAIASNGAIYVQFSQRQPAGQHWYID